MTHPSLVRSLSKLSIRSPKKQMKVWVEQKRTYLRVAALIRSLGKPSVTKPQAKRLDELGLGYEDLVKLRSEYMDTEVFMKVLKDKGINSKPHRVKLAKISHH